MSLPSSSADFHFTGVVDSVSGPDVTFSPGDAFDFTIEVNFSAEGYLLSLGGDPAFLGADHYAANYVSGDAVMNVGWDGWVEHYYWDDTGNNRGVVQVLNNLAVYSSPGSGGIEDWQTGTNINFAQDWAYFSGTTRITNHIFGHVTSVTAASVDDDSDGVLNEDDNCSLIPNASQQDSNGDNIGNACDADLNDDCVVNAVDLGILKSVFFSGDADADFNGDGVVNATDLGVLRSSFFSAPGPSGLPNICE